LELSTVEEMGGLEACANRAANLEALQATQPALAAELAGSTLVLDWCYARDGALTARTADGKWWSGCSVPRAAALSMFGKLDVQGTTACFVGPTHPAQLAVALEKLRGDQAMIAIVPEPQWVAAALHLTDFSADIQRHRLWFAAGDDWGGQLERLFEQQPGLPTPQQFIRTGLLGEHDATPLMSQAERVVSRVNETRASWVEAIRQSLHTSPGPNRRVFILRPSRFRLYDASAALAATLEAEGPVECRRLDPDDPASVSGLSLAMAAAECDVVVVADRGRGDLPPVLCEETPVITWVTAGRIPAFTAAGPRDGLLLVDGGWRRAAQAAGWPASRVGIAGWPQRCPPPPAPTPRVLALIADTRPVSEPGEDEMDLSSHRLLWETIAEEIARDPLCVGGDAAGYLRGSMQRLGVAPEGLDARRFVDELIVPAWQQGVARLLIGAGLPVQLFGRGWDQLEGLDDHWRGGVGSNAQLDAAVACCAVLVQPAPAAGAHAVRSLGRPMLGAAPANRDELVEAARGLLRGGKTPPAPQGPALSAAVLRELLG
jgi:hypothetical protein